MKRYIVLYHGEGEKPDADVQQIRNSSGVKILDETSKTLFVEGSPAELKRAVEGLPSWSVEPEKAYRASPPRVRVKKAATGYRAFGT